MDIGHLVGVPSEESVARRVRKGADRDQRDLFATPRPQLPPVRVGAASDAPSGMSGERNENSVLFTVADLQRGALTKSSTMPPPAMTPAAAPLPSSPPSSARRDDEGVFDLLAMCRDGGQVKARTAPLYEVESPFGPPVKSGSQADGLSMSIRPSENDGKKKLGVIIGVAAAAVVFLGVGMAVAFRGSEPEVKPSAAVAAPPPVATTVAIPIAQPAVDPVAASSAAPSNEKVATATKGGKKGGGKATASASGGAKTGKLTLTSTSAPAAPKVKKGASDPCGCHGNLQCAMRCGM
jgi:hypothetical protein